MKRFILETQSDDQREAIVDQEHQLNFLFLASSGFGTPAANLELAEKVVEFLNSLPPEETLLYPYNRK